MKYWLLIFCSSAVCGVTFWQLRFSDVGPVKNTGGRTGAFDALMKEAEPEIRCVEREIDEMEQQALTEWRALPIDASTRLDQVRVLGKLLLFDKNLSLNRNEACSFCHMPICSSAPR